MQERIKSADAHGLIQSNVFRSSMVASNRPAFGRVPSWELARGPFNIFQYGEALDVAHAQCSAVKVRHGEPTKNAKGERSTAVVASAQHAGRKRMQTKLFDSIPCGTRANRRSLAENMRWGGTFGVDLFCLVSVCLSNFADAALKSFSCVPLPAFICIPNKDDLIMGERAAARANKALDKCLGDCDRGGLFGHFSDLLSDSVMTSC